MGRTWGSWGTGDGGNIMADCSTHYCTTRGKQEREGEREGRFTLLNVECARLTPAPIMRNDNGRKLVIRNLRLAAIIT